MDAPENRSSENTDRDQHTFGGALAPVKDRAAAPWVVAGVVVLVVFLLVVFAERRHGGPLPNQVLALDPYARNLVISDLTMSESTSLSGGKSTFLDGVVRNAGPRTVTGANVQVLFANDEGMPPRIETVPLILIRTREPYVDTQPVSAAPLKPADQREFRLIFESLPTNWNIQLPEMRVVGVSTK